MAASGYLRDRVSDAPIKVNLSEQQEAQEALRRLNARRLQAKTYHQSEEFNLKGARRSCERNDQEVRDLRQRIDDEFISMQEAVSIHDAKIALGKLKRAPNDFDFDEDFAEGCRREWELSHESLRSYQPVFEDLYRMLLQAMVNEVESWQRYRQAEGRYQMAKAEMRYVDDDAE